MRTGKYELVMIWETGEKEVHEFLTEDQATRSEIGIKQAFGEQVWTCVRPQYA